MDISVRTRDTELLHHLLSKQAPQINDKTMVGAEVVLTYRGSRRDDSFMPGPEYLDFVVDIPTAVAAGFFVNWLWQKLKTSEVTTITVNKRRILEFKEGELRRIIIEETRKTSESASDEVDTP